MFVLNIHQGKCICRDNTAGDNCELCARGFYGNALGGEPDDCKPCPCPGQGACIELYEDTVACLECPTGYTGHKCDICIDGWFGEPDNEMPCRECDCNGNVDPNAVGNCNRTSGECLKCIHDTAGFSCDRCLPGYFGDPLALPKGDCRTCGCNPVGTMQLEDEPEGPYLCDQLSGQCQCKAFVAGEKCERCVNGYWNILSGQGCEECDCDPVGSFNTSCDISSGQCFCREGVVGRKCDQCAVNMFGFSREGCLPCTCDPIGSLELQCAPDGQCPCRENVEGIHCDRCKENKYDRQAGCRDCPPCYTLVQEAVDAHRVKLQQLSALISNVTDNPALPDDREFEQRLQEVVTVTEQLFKSAEQATSGERSPLELLDEMQERLDEVKQLAGKIATHMEETRVLSVQGERNTSEAQQLMERLEQVVRETQLFLERDGADALRRAVEQSKQFGIQSGRMSEIAREARGLADQHELSADQVADVADAAVTNATAAYDLAYRVIEQQRNFSNEIQLLHNSLDSTEQLIGQTRGQAEEAQRDATDAYDAALNVYAEAKSGFADVDVDSLKKRADELKTEVQRLKADLEVLTSEHEPLLDELEQNADTVAELLDRGLAQQQAADELMADVDAARDKAEKAVVAGEKTLEEARKTLETLQGFDRQVQESRELASEALREVDQIAEQIAEAERKTADAREALQGAESNAEFARDMAAEAEAMAQQAQQEATEIQTESAKTREEADGLREAAVGMVVQVSDTTASVEAYEQQLSSDSKLALEARQKANQAKSSAEAASAKVDAALAVVREVQQALRAAGDIDSAALDQLESRLQEAERELDEAQLQQRLDALRTNRTQQDRMLRDYEEQLALLRDEVANIEEIADALPTACYARVKLEP
ncbi:laminin subunit gamma-1-like [Pollicipes pollicipes]|uniref:laminin subunit gamma-1-like n=1 Tax=Pollicipes pollicipes TaxID=41117 RepID=UPI001884B9DD|nr:laminin subunit gamma-1-like [Pollicipes pollicipes]